MRSAKNNCRCSPARRDVYKRQMLYALSLQMKSPQAYQRPPFVDVTEAQKVALNKALVQIKAMG